MVIETRASAGSTIRGGKCGEIRKGIFACGRGNHKDLKSQAHIEKTIDAPYAPGNRGLWRKAKWLNRQECLSSSVALVLLVILGFAAYSIFLIAKLLIGLVWYAHR